MFHMRFSEADFLIFRGFVDKEKATPYLCLGQNPLTTRHFRVWSHTGSRQLARSSRQGNPAPALRMINRLEAFVRLARLVREPLIE